MNGKLEPHFLKFIGSLSDAELIDHLQLTPAQKAAKKADAFFRSRSVIGEVKLLATDTSPKIRAILQPYENTEHWPVFYGEWPISKVLAHLPDGERLNRKIFDSVTSTIPDIVRDANRQIRETKTSFDLTDSRGVLIVLNDTIDILSPDVIAHRVAEALNKKTPAQNVRFPEIGYVWVLSETHTAAAAPGVSGLVSVLLDHPLMPDDGTLYSFLDDLQQRWAAFNGMPFYRAQQSSGRVSDIPFQPRNAAREPDRIPRSELWRRQYAAKPYLRTMPTEELLEYGAKLTLTTGRGFLIGSTASREEQRIAIERWTHFLEEVNFRGIDLRTMKPFIDANADLLD